jgi:hypothetical protein
MHIFVAPCFELLVMSDGGLLVIWMNGKPWLCGPWLFVLGSGSGNAQIG